MVKDVDDKIYNLQECVVVQPVDGKPFAVFKKLGDSQLLVKFHEYEPENGEFDNGFSGQLIVVKGEHQTCPDLTLGEHQFYVDPGFFLMAERQGRCYNNYAPITVILPAQNCDVCEKLDEVTAAIVSEGDQTQALLTTINSTLLAGINVTAIIDEYSTNAAAQLQAIMQAALNAIEPLQVEIAGDTAALQAALQAALTFAADNLAFDVNATQSGQWEITIADGETITVGLGDISALTDWLAANDLSIDDAAIIAAINVANTAINDNIDDVEVVLADILAETKKRFIKGEPLCITRDGVKMTVTPYELTDDGAAGVVVWRDQVMADITAPSTAELAASCDGPCNSCDPCKNNSKPLGA